MGNTHSERSIGQGTGGPNRFRWVGRRKRSNAQTSPPLQQQLQRRPPQPRPHLFDGTLCLYQLADVRAAAARVAWRSLSRQLSSSTTAATRPTASALTASSTAVVLPRQIRMSGKFLKKLQGASSRKKRALRRVLQQGCAQVEVDVFESSEIEWTVHTEELCFVLDCMNHDMVEALTLHGAGLFVRNSASATTEDGGESPTILSLPNQLLKFSKLQTFCLRRTCITDQSLLRDILMALVQLRHLRHVALDCLPLVEPLLRQTMCALLEQTATKLLQDNRLLESLVLPDIPAGISTATATTANTHDGSEEGDRPSSPFWKALGQSSSLHSLTLTSEKPCPHHGSVGIVLKELLLSSTGRNLRCIKMDQFPSDDGTSVRLLCDGLYGNQTLKSLTVRAVPHAAASATMTRAHSQLRVLEVALSTRILAHHNYTLRKLTLFPRPEDFTISSDTFSSVSSPLSCDLEFYLQLNRQGRHRLLRRAQDNDDQTSNDSASHKGTISTASSTTTRTAANDKDWKRAIVKATASCWPHSSLLFRGLDDGTKYINSRELSFSTLYYWLRANPTIIHRW